MEHLALLVGAGSWVGVASLIFCMVKYFPSQKFCDRQLSSNDADKQRIRDWIEENEGRAVERHKEYREDMKEVKALIRNGGNSKPRVQT